MENERPICALDEQFAIYVAIALFKLPTRRRHQDKQKAKLLWNNFIPDEEKDSCNKSMSTYTVHGTQEACVWIPPAKWQSTGKIHGPEGVRYPVRGEEVEEEICGILLIYI